MLLNDGNSGDIYGDKKSNNLWNSTDTIGNIFIESAFVSAQVYLKANRISSDANGLFQVWSQTGGNSSNFDVRADGHCFAVKFHDTCDERIKKDIVQINDYDELSHKFDQINLYEYGYQSPYAYDMLNERTEEGLNKRVVGWIAQNIQSNFAQAIDVRPNVYDDETHQYIASSYLNKETGERLEVPNQLTVDKSALNTTLWAKVKKMDKIMATLTERITQLENIITANNLSV